MKVDYGIWYRIGSDSENAGEKGKLVTINNVVKENTNKNARFAACFLMETKKGEEICSCSK